MSARPKSISKSSFRLNDVNAFVVRGDCFNELCGVELRSHTFQWVKVRFEKPLNDHAVIVMAMPRYGVVPDPLPPGGTLLPGDLTIKLVSASGEVKHVHLPVFYQAP